MRELTPFFFDMKVIVTIVLFIFGMSMKAHAQLPVEVYAGQERASLDLMFFKYFKNEKEENSPWLYFNRERILVNYEMTDSTNLPFFASVNAVSYNAKRLKGFAPVVVGQLTTGGVAGKAGVQFARVRSNFTFFTWAVSELSEDPSFDYFLLLRYKPKLTDRWNGFLQGESFNVFPSTGANLQFYQRCRFGLDRHAWQFGFALDMSQIGRNGAFTSSVHPGVFLRHEFN